MEQSPPQDARKVLADLAQRHIPVEQTEAVKFG
jgi:hypothetical protein